MKNKTYKIAGEFIINNSKFFIDNTELQDDDTVHLPLRTLKAIINDAKNNII